jgi:hypothetical protein
VSDRLGFWRKITPSPEAIRAHAAAHPYRPDDERGQGLWMALDEYGHGLMVLWVDASGASHACSQHIAGFHSEPEFAALAGRVLAWMPLQANGVTVLIDTPY